ncbi:MAG: hypothetical protein FJX71_05335 [Alphaproteobacteria bacterium]|nr:hypothetical protein [Alphaproteobacteria bacterium]
MRLFLKISAVTFFGLLSASGADAPLAEQAPLTPRTSALREFLHEVADEKFGLNLKTDSEKQRTVLRAENPENKNLLIGLFPQGTKSGQIVSFIESIANGSVQYPITEANTGDGPDVPPSKVSRIISDQENQRFLILSFIVPEPQSPQAAVAPVPSPSTSEPERPHYDILLERLEGFLAKAQVDVQVQAKRLEGFGQKAGKDLEKAGQNIRKVFKKGW